MTFDPTEMKHNYARAKSTGRELAKWIFAISTFGLGALWLWATTIVVREGEIGLRQTAGGDMVLLPPGRHSNFPWESYPVDAKSLASDLIELGPYKIITVKTGYVARTYRHGELVILKEGRHLINDAAHTVAGFISTQQETKRLDTVMARTFDNVGLTLETDVRYQIKDPKLAVSQINDIDKSIREIAEMYLSQAVSHHNLSEFAPAAGGLNQSIVAVSNEQKGIGSLITELMDSIKEQLSKLGIELISIGITSYKLNDPELAHQLGQSAVVASQTQAKLMTVKNDAEVKKIATDAEAEARVKLARADAESTVIREKALAEALAIRGNAVAELGAKLKENPVAQEVYARDQQTEMVKHAQNANLFFGPGVDLKSVTPTLITSFDAKMS